MFNAVYSALLHTMAKFSWVVVAIVLMVEPIMALEKVAEKFLQLFQGLGKLKNNYSIKIENNSQQYVYHVTDLSYTHVTIIRY